MKKSSLCECGATAEEQYISSFRAFHGFYLRLVIAVGTACAAAIVIAVVFNVILGIALAFFSSIAYLYFTAAELKRRLGISYRNTNGNIIVTHIKAVYGNTIYIPEKLLWCNVSEISDRAFVPSDGINIENLYLSKSIKHIGKDIFGDVPANIAVHYEGSADDWQKICKETNFSELEIIFDAPQPKVSVKERKSPEGTEANL